MSQLFGKGGLPGQQPTVRSAGPVPPVRSSYEGRSPWEDPNGGGYNLQGLAAQAAAAATQAAAA
eukprot:5970988-Pyramimonas_sp.AAC.1